MLFKFFPEEFNFFDTFDKQVDSAVESACYFKELALKGEVDESSVKKMHSLEHQGDESAHNIIAQLNKTFITPFDREDIHALAKEIDNIIDMINTIVRRLYVYKLNGVNKNLIEFASIIENSTRVVSCAVKNLKNMKNSSKILEACRKINDLENIGDSFRDTVLVELFETQKDPILVMKWKEIYEDAETVLDVCEDVAHIVESIMVKQA